MQWLIYTNTFAVVERCVVWEGEVINWCTDLHRS